MRRTTYTIRRAGTSGLILALFVLLGMAAASAQKGKQLDEHDVLELLQGGVPSERVTEIVNERGISFDFTAQSEQRVRDAGGGDDVVAALKEASKRRAASEQASTGGLRVQTTPGEAQVYLNDEPKGITSPEGGLRLPGLQPGNYKLRVSALGYQSWENSVTVSAGDEQTVYVTLVQKSSENPGKGAPQPNRDIPPVAGSAAGIPIPGVKVSGVQFYEGGHDKTPVKSDRVYRDSFDQQSTRTIYWELNLKYPKPSQRIDFKVDAYWYKADGTQMTHQTKDAYVLPEWSSSWHTFGWGSAEPGTWAPGTYRVDLYVQNTRVASGSFQIQ